MANFFFVELEELQEVCSIARKSIPINVIVHYPQTEEGWETLRKRVSTVHADFVIRYIQKLNCPSEQKIQLLDAVIDTVKKQKPKKRALENGCSSREQENE